MPYQRERNAIADPSRTAATGFVRFAIKLAWDGTHYQGFQSQIHNNTIQDQLEFRLKRLLGGRNLRIFGWGRTDRGVHARAAVVTVDLSDDEVQTLATARSKEKEEDTKILAALSIQSALRHFSCDGGTGSITALSVKPVSATFDPKFSSIWKRYVYFIACGSETQSPFGARYTWQMDCSLDLNRMEKAATLLSGRHNFLWLSIEEAGEQRSPILDLALKVEQVDAGPFCFLGDAGKLIKISGTSEYFLYRMMRRIVGVLVGVGTGRADIDLLNDFVQRFDNGVFSPKDASQMPLALKQTAPAQGLCLDYIKYGIPL